MLSFWSYRGFDGNNNPRRFQYLLFSNPETQRSPTQKKKEAEDEGKKKEREEEEEGDIDTVKQRGEEARLRQQNKDPASRSCLQTSFFTQKTRRLPPSGVEFLALLPPNRPRLALQTNT